MLRNKSLMLALVAGACCATSALAQPAATDLGTLTPSATRISVNASWAASSVTWYKFTVPDIAAPFYLDIDTRLPSTSSDTEIGVYLANPGDPTQSTLTANDDDSGDANLSLLSFGNCSARPINGTGAAPTGQNGATLAAGTYYVAVGTFNVTFGATNYGATSTGAAGSTTLTFVYNVGLNAPTITAASATPGAAGSTVLLTATLGTCNRAGSTVTVNTTALGGSATTPLTDDGLNGDVTAGDGIYSTNFTLPVSAGAGLYNLLVTGTNGADSSTRTMPLIVSGEGVVKSVRISQATGAGGLSATDATYDYVELYNADLTAADLSGYSLQLASATGTTWTSVVLPNGFTMQAGRYALIRLEAASATGIAPALTPDLVGSTSPLSSTGGKIALVNTTTTLTGAVPVVPGTAVYIDRLGYGSPSAGFPEGTARAAPASPNRILVRGCNGALDAGNNSTDFAPTGMTATLPRNSTSAASNSGPGLNNVTVTPASGLSPFSATITAAAAPCGAGVTISSMKINLSAVGGPANAVMLDNGANGDGSAGDGVYGIAGVTVTGVPGTYTLPIRLVDSSGNITNGSASVTINVPPPANDECASAIALTGAGQFAFNNFNATTSTPAYSCGSGGTDIWYRWTPSAPGAYSIRTCDTAVSFDTVIQVYDGTAGCPIDSSASLGCNDDATAPCGSASTIRLSRVELVGIVANRPYYIRVGTFASGAGAPGTLTIEALGTRATGAANPATISELANATFFVTVSPGAGTTIVSATADTSSISSTVPSIALHDDGVAPDVTAGDNIFSGSVATDHAAGSFTVPFLVTDSGGGTASGTMGLTIVVVNGACCVSSVCSIQGAVACAAAGGTYTAGATCGGSNYSSANGAEAIIDISATGTLISATPTTGTLDDGQQTVALPFTFNYLGNNYAEVSVCTNGFIQFGSTYSTTFTNAAIPSTGTPNNIICPLWDDFDGTAGGSIYYQIDGEPGSRRFIALWSNLPQFLVTDANTFEVILYEGSNNFEFRYGTITAEAASGDYTVGFENVDGTFGRSVTGASLGTGSLSILWTAANDPSPCSCSTDINHDGVTDPDDLADAIGCFFDPTCNFDYDNSGFEDPDDLSTYISDFFTPNFCG